MTTFKPKSIFQYSVNIRNGPDIVNDYIITPPFASAQDVFWQLKFNPNHNIMGKGICCSLTLWAIPSPLERKNLEWSKDRENSRSILFIEDKLVTYEAEVNLDILESISESTYNCKRASGVYTIKDTLKDPITFGIKFQDFKSLIMQSPTTSFWIQPLPDNLRNAWEKQFERPDMSDVRFIVNGKNFFASSNIISQRSSYFTNVFSGQWLETNYYNDITSNKTISATRSTLDMKTLHSTDSNSYHLPIKYTVKIPDFHHETFRELLRYFYMNEVIFNIGNETTSPSSPFNILLIADKYLVTNLCEIAKAEVLRTLTIENSAMILFNSAGMCPDLKDKVLEFVIKNFSKVRETSGFEYIMDNYSMFSSNFGNIMKEIMKLMIPKNCEKT
ncbi:uncharacterized protein OCT59_014341 [Rhizophagus irregularis]|uniref:BTB domain-containing protein n=3 Tax=Rhizophagus irregularis TaxID=588596 RepID=A0A015JN50_RHIIW|nr:hypothetical protein RirG_216680 [Rhizophagus irregularis DAOM 197198w]UZO21961.1 hypothetical protein OCT59_014341 [Rhizophagus irregularis]CAG8515172.1 372_t:CDS:2 [Rhizophagus irregularis]